jgi:hypothetical protein
LNSQDLPALNSLLQKYGQAALPAVPADMPCGN